MKNVILTLGLSFLSMMAMAQPEMKPVGGTGPMLSLNKEVHDYGTITQGGNGECEFIVTNTGDQPLIISQCQGSCGCTVPQCETAPIKPGATSIIKVKYDSSRLGAINKSVTITSNATNAPSKVITIKGMMEAAAVTPGATPATPTKLVPAGTTH